MPVSSEIQSALEVLRCHNPACRAEVPVEDVILTDEGLTCPRCGGHQWGELGDE